MKVIIFTWSNHHLVTKTSCFGMRFIHFTTLCNTLFTNKTTCFGLMKAYEGKTFAFIRASCWLLTPYTNYEGKLNFKQKYMGIKGDWAEMITKRIFCCYMAMNVQSIILLFMFQHFRGKMHFAIRSSTDFVWKTLKHSFILFITCIFAIIQEV